MATTASRWALQAVLAILAGIMAACASTGAPEALPGPTAVMATTTRATLGSTEAETTLPPAPPASAVSMQPTTTLTVAASIAQLDCAGAQAAFDQADKNRKAAISRGSMAAADAALSYMQAALARRAELHC